MEVNGKCHCGNIRYKAEVDPADVVICHCTDCQILTGCPYRVSAKIPLSAFKLLAGKEKKYIKTADSGIKRALGFCPECGTPLYTEPLEDPKVRFLRVGCMAERALLKPTRQIWCRSALPWSENISQILPKLQQQDA